ncbi:LLM class flavin-dependent oxidoreductase [Streptomyces sp. NBC_01077]|uniref:LLM class flavin-dependent oxidoreductase n=1 Tax=Streptomyces sp. NBC_01077 TaxID=2903746 RepID=UPI00386631E3|nr:LLM class flavin-dependent oxidoreductase [Streptomyces sp. NBC_01077]WSV43581.1 LLM class flavin-dependent oxidoreductase [Streptomyces sp. NBC_01077]
MNHIDFGLFDWLDRADLPPHRLYAERLRLLEAADSAGFYAYHLAEHHATPLGMAPSPALFLAAAAQRTRQIRLGPLAYVLPLYNPLRLIEEVCMLDHLSGGRLELGVGRGASPYELGYYGVDTGETRALFNEVLALLTSGLTHSRLSFEGEHYRFHDVPMELEPLQQPYPPLWYPTHNPESIEYAAVNGFNFVGLGPAGFVRQLTDAYWQNWKSSLQDRNRLNGHVTQPKAGILRHVFVADTEAEARAVTHVAYDNWFGSLNKLWHSHNDPSMEQVFGWDGAVQNETILFGTPARVREQVAELLEVSGCNYVICAFAWGSLSQQQALHSLHLFAQEVVPAFADEAFSS